MPLSKFWKVEQKVKVRPFKLTIQPQIEDYSASETSLEYVQHFEKQIEKILAETHFEDTKDFLAWTNDALPIVKWGEEAMSSDSLKLFIFCRDYHNALLEEAIFFFIKQRVFPGEATRPLNFRYLPFRFEEIPQATFFACDLHFLHINGRLRHQIKSNLPHLAQDIALALRSPAFAKYAPQAGMPFNLKNAAIYERLVPIQKRLPHHFDNSLLTDFTRLLWLSSPEFIAEREPEHIVRLICSHTIIYKQLARSLRLFPDERHLLLRFMRVKLAFPFGTKSVLGLAIGICPLSEYEHFSEKHILIAVQQLMPSVTVVQNSFYINQAPHDHIRLLYVELEKNDGTKFSLDEIKLLKDSLPDTLKLRVEKVFPSLFMTRNEEEVMKNILILGQALRHRESLPQVMISFESQSATELVFTVIVVHLVRNTEKSFEKKLLKTKMGTWVPNRVQAIDYLDNKTSKEAVVFEVKMHKSPQLLRADFSVNFYLARQLLVETLQEIFGPIRDYNGGLIFQQGEQFAEFRRAFPKEAASRPDLVENFFYSLTPIEVQGTLSQELLKKLFTLCLETTPIPLPKQESYLFKTETHAAHTFAVVRMKDPVLKDSFLNALDILRTNKSFISTAVTFQGCHILGYIHKASPEHSKEQFIATLEQAIAEGLAKLHDLRVLRLAFPNLPVSLDPRIGGDVYSAMILKMLFEGLMKFGNDGEVTHGICKSVEISPDGKKYVFILRETFWSNGSPVTAHDFTYAWKKILSPDFYTAYTYLFYPIKHAKEVKSGKLSPNQLGLEAFDDHTLFVELEHPAPYFLELTAHSIYSPVPRALDETHPNWAHQIGSGYVCNGPFQLTKKSRSQGMLELTKNLHYWDADPLQPDRAVIMQAHDHSALEMFKNDEIDWLGSPLQAWNLRLFARGQEHVESLTSSGVFWSVFNTQRFPFHNLKLRQAFSYGTNRKALIEAFAYEGFAAHSPLPRMHSQYDASTCMDGDEEKAYQLFCEALVELGITKSEFPHLTLVHSFQDPFLRDVIQAMTAQWERIFSIKCKIESYTWGPLFDRLVHGDFQFGFVCWEAWVNDPIYTLNSFKYGNEKMNFPKWENAEFQKLLDLADMTIDLEQRNEYLRQAELILIQEVPAMPVLYEIQQFIKKGYVQVPTHKNSATFSFRSALINKNFH